jgi:hypothetical protein
MRFVRCKTTSSYEAMILTPRQGFDVLMHLQEPERTLTLLASATGLRISECLGCNGRTWTSRNRRLMSVARGRVARSVCQRAGLRTPLCRSILCLPSSWRHGRTRLPSPNPEIGCSRPSSARGNGLG